MVHWSFFISTLYNDELCKNFDLEWFPPLVYWSQLQRQVQRQEHSQAELCGGFPFQYLVQRAVMSTRWRGRWPETVEVLVFQRWFLRLLSCCCRSQGFVCSSPGSRARSSLRCNLSHTHTLHSGWGGTSFAAERGLQWFDSTFLEKCSWWRSKWLFR